jgi:hypothetical protein
MPGPSASFAGTGQRDGVITTSSGRGRGSHNRLAPYQNRNVNNNNPARESKPSGRGRGVGIVHRGRGEVSSIPAGGGGGARNFQRGRSDGVAKKVQLTSNSPFAQLKQQTPPRPTALPANSNKPSSFASVSVKNNNNPGGFGAPSVPNAAPGFSVGWNQDRRRRRVPRASSPMATSSVPVEDVGMMSSYHERYEKVGLT